MINDEGNTGEFRNFASCCRHHAIITLGLLGLLSCLPEVCCCTLVTLQGSNLHAH